MTGEAALKALMEAAEGGDRQAAGDFFLSILNAALFVPLRSQDMNVGAAASHGDFFPDILKVQDDTRNVAPAFLSASDLEKWCGAVSSFRTFTLGSLISVLPEEWWVCLNPGGEVEKEFSPWELQLLKKGPEAVPEILCDLFDQISDTVLEAVEVREYEYPLLKSALSERAGSISGVIGLYLLMSRGSRPSILIGTLISNSAQSEAAKIREEISDTAQKALIGDNSFRVFVGTDLDSTVSLSIFRDTAPFYRPDCNASGRISQDLK